MSLWGLGRTGLGRSPDVTDTAAFKRWFGNSVVINPDGTPKVVYHGTSADFDTFDYAYYGKTDWGFAGRGFYFMNFRDWAEGYAAVAAEGTGKKPRVIEAYLKLENPFLANEYEDIPGSPAGSKVPTKEEALFMQKSLIGHGYDGVIVKGQRGNPTEFVVFDPRQIKSVNNRGTFDPNDPNILHGLRRSRGLW